MHPLIAIPLVGAAIGAGIRVVKAKRNRFQYLEGPIAEGSTDLKLSGGPRYGQAVLVTVPVVVGEAIPADALGIRATDAVRGQYVVTELGESLHRAVAKWVLAP